MEGYALARGGEMEAAVLPTSFEDEPVPGQRTTIVEVSFDLATMTPTGLVAIEVPEVSGEFWVHREEIVPLQFASLVEGFLPRFAS